MSGLSSTSSSASTGLARTGLLVALALAACTPQTGYSRGGLVGAHDIVMNDGYVFITSADTNDLRVLQLDVPNSFQRTYVPAPNPLESLSIPTINRPTDLTIDDHWNNGRVSHGNYIYVSRPGGSEMSVVSGDRSEFREIARLVTPAPVTTTVAVRVDADTSRIYFATYDGAISTLYSMDLPTLPSALRGLSAAALTALIKPIVSFGSDTVAAMLVIPPLGNRTSDNQLFCDSGNHCLVIATRRDGGKDGQTLMFDPVSLRTAKLAFPGPVRFLTTHPQTIDPFTMGVGREAGQRIFGILDEEKCGGSACGGILAVETVAAYSASGGFPIAQYQNDAGPMLPLNFGDSLPTGVAVGGNPAYDSTDGGPTVTRVLTSNDGGLSLTWYASLGVATAANGSITFFDATTLQQIDGDDEVAHADQAIYLDENGYPAPWVTGVDAGLDESLNSHTITVADGVWRSQTIYTYYQGVLTEAAFPIAAASTTVALPQSLIPRMKLGDFLIFATPSGFCADAPITAIGTDTVSIAQVPPDCTGVVSFLIRAGPAAPFAIFRTQVPQYLGRAAAGEEFVWNDAPVYVRLSGYNPDTPALKFGLGLDTVANPPPRGVQWQFFIASGYSPYSFIVDPNSVACATQLPGKVLFDEVRAHMYVIYPSSNSLIDVDPSLAQRVALGALQGTYCYH